MGTGNIFAMAVAGTIGIGALSLPACARDGVAASTELSAQSQPAPPQARKSSSQRPPPAARPARPAPAPRAVPRSTTSPAPVQRSAPRSTINPTPVQRSAPPNVPNQPRVQQNVGAPQAPRVVAPVTAAPRVITVPRQGSRTYTPRGANSTAVRAARIRGVPVHGAGRTTIQSRNYSVWRNNYRVRRGNGWRTFVALGVLGTIVINATPYYPYAYIEAPAPYCDGRTQDGCQLVFEDVETVEGDIIGQCVAYCPWQ